jgi:hypothetical protein
LESALRLKGETKAPAHFLARGTVRPSDYLVIRLNLQPLSQAAEVAD